MKKLSMAVVVVLGLVMVVGNAEAAERGVRQREQQVRIHQGVRSGELTRHEAVKLEAQHQQIRREIKKARADGRITPAERAKIDRKQDRLSKRIYRQKHDGQVR